MQIGIIGLGKMGGNMVRRLARQGHQCVVFDQNPAAIKALVGEQVTGGADLKQLVAHLDKPRAVWVMLPAGAITGRTVTQIGVWGGGGDYLIEGGDFFLQGPIRESKTPGPTGVPHFGMSNTAR